MAPVQVPVQRELSLQQVDDLGQGRVDFSGGPVWVTSELQVRNDAAAFETRRLLGGIAPATVLRDWDHVEEKVRNEGGVYVQAWQGLRSPDQDRQQGQTPRVRVLVEDVVVEDFGAAWRRELQTAELWDRGVGAGQQVHGGPADSVLPSGTGMQVPTVPRALTLLRGSIHSPAENSTTGLGRVKV